MVFCNEVFIKLDDMVVEVTILILIDGFLQFIFLSMNMLLRDVTILILIDGFLQCVGGSIMSLFNNKSQSLF